MFLRELLTSASYIQILSATLFTYLPFRVFSGSTIIIDSTTRLNCNDAYFSTYYFWWTNLTYLPLFFFLVTVFILLFWIPKSSKVLVNPILMLLVAYAFELKDYIILNADDMSTLYGVYGVNTLLVNALNKYHPLVFYVSVGLLVATLIKLSTYSEHRNYYFTYPLMYSNLRNLNWATPQINLIALWMGSWWAIQEGTWGGWWNWDPSETFGLLVTLLAITSLHSENSKVNVHKVFIKSKMLFLYFLLSYFFIQLNFDLVSHNFGSKFFFFFNNNLFFLESSQLIITCLVIILMSIISLNSLTRRLLTESRPPLRAVTWQIRLLPLLALVLFVCWSFRPLINYFMWNFLELNIINFEPSLQPLVVFMAIFLAALLIHSSRFLLLLASVLSLFFLTWLPLVLLSLTNLNLIRVVHLVLCSFVLNCLLTYGLSPVEWINLHWSNFMVVNKQLLILNYELFTIDTLSYEPVSLWTFTEGSHSVVWNINTFANTPLNNFFLLSTWDGSCQNLYNLGGSYSTGYLNLELPFINNLNTLFLLALFLMLRLWTSNKYLN